MACLLWQVQRAVPSGAAVLCAEDMHAFCLEVYYSLPTASYLLPTTYCLLLATYYLLPTTYCSSHYLVVTSCLQLLLSYLLLPTTYYLLSRGE